MTDPPRRPPSQPPGEMSSAPPPLPGGWVRPPPVQRGLVRISPPVLLGIILGSFVAGLAALPLLVGAVGILWDRQAAPIAAENEDEEAGAFADLYLLAFMEQQDGPLSHELNMWLLGADLAKRGYHLGGSKKQVPATIKELSPATIGVRMLESPDSRPFERIWRLDRGGRPDQESVRSYVCIELPDGHYSLRMDGASSSEWNRVLARVPNPVWEAGSNLIDEACQIYWTDNGEDTWDGPKGKPYKVVKRSTGPAPDRLYHLVLTEDVGAYWLKLVLLDSLGEQPGWSRLELWFTYSVAEDPPR